jgi:hypothetical protein
MDVFVIFFVGIMVGVILGVFIMAVAVAAGRGRKEMEDVFTSKEELSKEESEWLIDFITKDGDNK